MPGSWDDPRWNSLIDDVREGNCTPFIGAGASVPYIPTGGQVAGEWADLENYPFDDRNNLVSIAQFLSVKYNEMEPKASIARKIAGCPRPDFADAQDVHRALADLGLPIYITTNYDDFMVSALKAAGRTPVRRICPWRPQLVKAKDLQSESDVPSAQSPMVFHLHGALDDRKGMVLTEDDYLEFLVQVGADLKIIPLPVQGAISDTRLLFLGYSLSDM